MKKSKTLLVLFTVMTLLLGFTQTASAAEVQQNNVIETSATSVINVTPDIVRLKLSIRTEDQSSSLAQQSNASAVNKVIDALVQEGISQEDIKTTTYSTYSYTKTVKDKDIENDIKVYVTNSSLAVTTKDLSKVGDILGILANITEVNVDSVNCTLQDPAKYKEQVIAAAIASAKQNILYSADALGLELDKLVYLRIDYSPNQGINPYNGVSSSIGAAVPQPQNPDEITISATANLSYSVK